MVPFSSFLGLNQMELMLLELTMLLLIFGVGRILQKQAFICERYRETGRVVVNVIVVGPFVGMVQG